MKKQEKLTEAEAILKFQQVTGLKVGTNGEVSVSNVTDYAEYANWDLLTIAKEAWYQGDISLPVYSTIAVKCSLPSIANRKTVYQPSGRAREYAFLATNPYRGCEHGCKYCYAPKVLRMKPKEFHASATLRDSYLEKLKRDLCVYQQHGITKQVQLCFTTDPYTPSENGVTRQVIELIHSYGLGVNVLTKGGMRAARDIDLFEPECDSFGVTLTSLDEDENLLWEPNAAPASERIEVLRLYAEKGLHTYVSLEPVLSAKDAIAIIESTLKFTSLYKVGKMNYVNLYIDWMNTGIDILDVLSKPGMKCVDGTQENQCGYYVKHDLRDELKRGIGKKFTEVYYKRSVEGIHD